MIRVCGLFLAAGGCALWGFRAADECVARVRLLDELVQAVQVLERELSLFSPSLPVLLERMAQGRNKQIKDMLIACCTELEKGKDFTDIWAEQLGKLSLEAQETGLLCGLGRILGQYDDKGQVQAAARIRRELEQCAAHQREENRTRGRMYRMLGVTAGGFLALTLV